MEAQPTSGDEMPPPSLQPFLRNGAKSKSAAKRAPSVSAAARRSSSAKVQPKERSMDRSRSQPRITGGPIRPLSPKQVRAPSPMAPERKKPMAMLPEGAQPVKPWQEQRLEFLRKSLEDLSSTWPSHCMSWINMHVAGSYYDCEGITHPRQLAACSLRCDSNATHRWACWACQIDPVSAAEAGFSPGKSIWHSSTQQCFHWCLVDPKCLK